MFYMDRQIIVKDIITNTTVNEEGKRLFDVMSDFILKGDSVILSLSDLEPMSSSFMNSSFGALIDKYGKQTFKKKVRFTNYRPAYAEKIVNYINLYESR